LEKGNGSLKEGKGSHFLILKACRKQVCCLLGVDGLATWRFVRWTSQPSLFEWA